MPGAYLCLLVGRAAHSLTQLNAALASRKEKLAAALEHEKAKEALRVEFAEAAANFKAHCEATQEVSPPPCDVVAAQLGGDASVACGHRPAPM